MTMTKRGTPRKHSNGRKKQEQKQQPEAMDAESKCHQAGTKMAIASPQLLHPGQYPSPSDHRVVALQVVAVVLPTLGLCFLSST